MGGAGRGLRAAVRPVTEEGIERVLVETDERGGSGKEQVRRVLDSGGNDPERTRGRSRKVY